MALLTEQRVRAAAKRAKSDMRQSIGRVITESIDTKRDRFDVFLSHSLTDAEIILGTLTIFNDFGFSVYVDWSVDQKLKRDRLTHETVTALRQRMQQCDSLLYLKTENSIDSSWMPWELGYFDAYKGRIGILPIARMAQDEYSGKECLGLYPYVDIAAVNSTGREALYINRSRDVYGPLREWISNPAVIRKRP